MCPAVPTMMDFIRSVSIFAHLYKCGTAALGCPRVADLELLAFLQETNMSSCARRTAQGGCPRVQRIFSAISAFSAVESFLPCPTPRHFENRCKPGAERQRTPLHPRAQLNSAS